MTFLLVQISDPHIGPDWGGGGTVARLAAARKLLERLRAPVHALPGDHDRRGALRRNYLGPVRLVALDKDAGRSVLVAPSTHVQATLAFDEDEPTGYAVRAFADGELVSHWCV